jgi:hypothetical protein
MGGVALMPYTDEDVMRLVAALEIEALKPF